MSTITINAETVEVSLEGQDVSNEPFGDFRIIKATHAPELNAIGIMANDGAQGYLFFGFLPYGSQLWI